MCLLRDEDFDRLAKELFITAAVVRKRFAAGPVELDKFAPMQLRKVLDFLNERFNLRDNTVKTFREKNDMVDYICRVAYSN